MEQQEWREKNRKDKEREDLATGNTWEAERNESRASVNKNRVELSFSW